MKTFNYRFIENMWAFCLTASAPDPNGYEHAAVNKICSVPLFLLNLSSLKKRGNWKPYGEFTVE
jgi:hypothetical protein